jgi:3-hydroxyisobutyrate dehydrogenase
MTRQVPVGFVGLGAMGWPMAANLAAAGIDLTVYDSDPSRQDRFVEENGCRSAQTADAFAHVGIAITMLPDERAVGQVAREWDGGLLSVLSPGSVLVDMSSSNPRATIELAEDARDRQLDLVDAPVSGGITRAADATLSIMVGGAERSIAFVEPTLSRLGKTLFRTGPVGSGHAMKALNNVVGATAYAILAEAMEVGRAFSLEPATMVAVINESTGRSFTSEVVFRDHVIAGVYGTGFALGLLAKDAGIADDMAASVDVRAPVMHLVADRWRGAVGKLGHAVDHSRAHSAWW